MRELNDNLMTRIKLRYNIQRLIDAAEAHIASFDEGDMIERAEAHRIRYSCRMMEDFFNLRPSSQYDPATSKTDKKNEQLAKT